ncbi:MAG: hypothetical protein NTV33_02145 [Coprothermobacterota bacterium]|nr:hypothetical protein [Coprothermobacterota bacterium]
MNQTDLSAASHKQRIAAYSVAIGTILMIARGKRLCPRRVFSPRRRLHHTR